MANTLVGLDAKNAVHPESAEACAGDLRSYLDSDVVSKLLRSAEVAKQKIHGESGPRVGRVPDAGRKQSRHESYSAY